MYSISAIGFYENILFLGGTYLDSSTYGTFLAKLNLYLNNTELTDLLLSDVDYFFDLDGSYTTSSFDTTYCIIKNELT